MPDNKLNWSLDLLLNIAYFHILYRTLLRLFYQITITRISTYVLYYKNNICKSLRPSVISSKCTKFWNIRHCIWFSKLVLVYLSITGKGGVLHYVRKPQWHMRTQQSFWGGKIIIYFSKRENIVGRCIIFQFTETKAGI